MPVDHLDWSDIPRAVVGWGLGPVEMARLTKEVQDLDESAHIAALHLPEDTDGLLLWFTPAGRVVGPLDGDHPTWGMCHLNLITGACEPLRSADKGRR